MGAKFSLIEGSQAWPGERTETPGGDHRMHPAQRHRDYLLVQAISMSDFAEALIGRESKMYTTS